MTTVPHFDRCPNIITSHRTLSDDIFTDIKVEMEEGQALRGGFKVENGLDSDVEFIPEDDDYIPEPVDAIHFVKVENCESTCELNGGGCENVTEDIRAEEDCDENNTGLDGIDKRLYVKLDKIDAHREVQKNKKDQVSYERKTLYKCPHCSYISCKKYTYTHHLTTHMTLAECASKNMLFQCNLCNYKSKRKYGLTQHMRRIHETIKPKNELIKSQTNKLPANKFSKIIFKCSHCEFETRLFTSLEKHSVSHKNTRTNKIYKCEVCGYEVKKLSGISRHVVTHSKSKKLRCNLCRYKTNRKDSLVQHLKKHKECAKKEEV